MRDHFTSFGELSSVVLEDTEAHNHDATLKPSLSCSACVTYTTRQSAEKAFIGGKSCKGHALRFMWLTASPGSNNQSRPQKTSVPVRASSISGQTQNMASESPSPVGEISSTATSGTAANPHSESMPTAESVKTSPVGISKASSFSSSLSSNFESPPEHDASRNAVFRDSDVHNEVCCTLFVNKLWFMAKFEICIFIAYYTNKFLYHLPTCQMVHGKRKPWMPAILVVSNIAGRVKCAMSS